MLSWMRAFTSAVTRLAFIVTKRARRLKPRAMSAAIGAMARRNNESLPLMRVRYAKKKATSMSWDAKSTTRPMILAKSSLSVVTRLTTLPEGFSS